MKATSDHLINWRGTTQKYSSQQSCPREHPYTKANWHRRMLHFFTSSPWQPFFFVLAKQNSWVTAIHSIAQELEHENAFTVSPASSSSSRASEAQESFFLPRFLCNNGAVKKKKRKANFTFPFSFCALIMQSVRRCLNSIILCFSTHCCWLRVRLFLLKRSLQPSWDGPKRRKNSHKRVNACSEVLVHTSSHERNGR